MRSRFKRSGKSSGSIITFQRQCSAAKQVSLMQNDQSAINVNEQITFTLVCLQYTKNFLSKLKFCLLHTVNEVMSMLLVVKDK
jgi:hypothetical protein